MLMTLLLTVQPRFYQAGDLGSVPGGETQEAVQLLALLQTKRQIGPRMTLFKTLDRLHNRSCANRACHPLQAKKPASTLRYRLCNTICQ